jgi:hypothetical protein
MQARKGVPGLALVLFLACGGCSGPNPAPRSQPVVEVGDSRVVPRAAAEGRWSVGPLFSLQDGQVILGDSKFSLRSKDRGRTWFRAPELPSRQLLQLGDGSFYVLDPLTRHAGERGHFLGRRLELTDLDDPSAWTEERWVELPVRVERWTDLHGDDGSPVSTFRFGGPMLELEDGTLLAGKAGNFAGDKAPMPGFIPTKGEKWFKYRTYLLASRDRGQSWHYLSTIAYDGVSGQESFCEPALVDLGGGELLSVMRTGRYAPMYQARSLDGGKTWGPPEPLKTLGLSPMMVLLPNGALVCSFGWRPFKAIPSQVDGGAYVGALRDYQQRYRSLIGIEDPSAAAGDYVMASFDKGHTWSRPTKVADPLTVGYTLLAATGPDTCLLLSRRIVIEGLSRAEVLQKWESEWHDWADKSGAVIEARQIRVTR